MEYFTLSQNVDRLYIPRKEGRRGLISIENCAELAIRGLEVQISVRKTTFTTKPVSLKIIGDAFRIDYISSLSSHFTY